MASKLDENTQFVDTAGVPLNAGKIYIGTVDLAPKTNTITIYSDRELTTTISNPQTLGSDGRPTNKIWIPGKYSLLVEDTDEVQQLIDLDAGETESTGISTLESVSGSDTITASGTTAVAAYVDKQVYIFKAVSINTGAVTLNIDSVGAQAIVKNFDQAIVAAEFEANQVVAVIYNSTNTNFEWVNHNLKTLHSTKGTDITSSTSITLPNDGNHFDVNGSTGPIGTINGIIGTAFSLKFVGTPTVTFGANIALPTNGQDFVAESGDVLEGFILTATTVLVTNISRFDGTPPGMDLVTQAVAEAGTAVAETTWSALRVRQAVESASALVPLAQSTASNSASVSFSTNITSTYDQYLIIIADIQPATDNSALWMRFIDNSSVRSSSTYQYARTENGTAVTATTDTEFELTSTNTDSSLVRPLGGNIWIFRDNANAHGSLVWNIIYPHSTSIISSVGGGVNGTAFTDLDGVQFLMSSGNITTGFFKLYGVRNS